jgi:dTDP-4-dehydrorhamnose reductase
MKNIVVLGGSGMLGSMVTDVLARDIGLSVAATVRSATLLEKCRERLPMVEWRLFDAATMDRNTLTKVISDATWIINAIGMTKPYIHDDNPKEIERAVRINALLPYELATTAAETGGRILQIATDCVYSGNGGRYVENDPHDPLDVYGKTKSLGEALLANMYCLRCSIVGPEPKAYVFLLEWFRRQPKNAQVNGYTNHQWNGVTTLHFAKLCFCIIRHGFDLPHVQHVIPSGMTSKAELLKCFARAYRREDITINPTEAKAIIDRVLATNNDTLNRQLWAAAGYAEPPSVPQMVAELAEFDYRMELGDS